MLLFLQEACSVNCYVAILKERKSKHARGKVIDSWKKTLEDLGGGEDFYQEGILRCSDRHPRAGLKTLYLKNRDDLDWASIEQELGLPAEYRWGTEEGATSANWLAYTDKVTYLYC